MKSVNFTVLTDLIHTAEPALRKFAHEFTQWLRQANWIEILLLCIPLAIMITLLPLIVVLFTLCIASQWLMRVTVDKRVSEENSTENSNPQSDTIIIVQQDKPATEGYK